MNHMKKIKIGEGIMKNIKENNGIALVTLIIIIVIAIIIIGISIFLIVKNNQENTNQNTLSSNISEVENYENTEETDENVYESTESEETEELDEKISWKSLFPDGGNRTTITFKDDDDDMKAFKLDYPENYELNVWQRDYEGQTVKDFIEKNGDVQNNVWVEKEYVTFQVYIETSQVSENETFTQRAQRKNPEGFALGTEEHPAWAYQDGGVIDLYYQGAQNYALVMRYNNSTSVNKYGAQAVAEFLYNMITYTEN